MKEIIIAGFIGGLLLSSGLVKADQVIFSQYDGVNTWNNVYVEIEDAKAFADANPGVAYALPTAHIETQAVEEVKAEDGRWDIKHVGNGQIQTWTKGENDSLWTRTDNGAQQTSGHLWWKANRTHNYEQVSVKWVTRSVEGVAHNVEQAMLPRAIVSVPTGVDLQEFIKAFMK